MRLRRVLDESFYRRTPEIVAEALLGKKVVRRLGNSTLEGVIVETEAYHGLNDPASRAYHGLKKFNKPMWEAPGRTFIYNVHKFWMFNIVAHKPNQIGAVLIRALEPTKGIDVMKRNRPVETVFDLTSGPGKLTVALGISKSQNGISVTSSRSEIVVVDSEKRIKPVRTHRIGVKRDVEKKLRFYAKGNNFVSKRSSRLINRVPHVHFTRKHS